MRSLHHSYNVNCRRVDVIGLEYDDFYKLFPLRNGDTSRRCHDWIKVARSLSINEVAPSVAFPRFDEREVRGKRAFEHIHATVELARFFAVGNECPVAGRGIETGDASARGAHSFRERALRHQVHLLL